MKKIEYIERNYEDRLIIDGQDMGRIDNHTLAELLCLLAKENIIDLQIKDETR